MTISAERAQLFISHAQRRAFAIQTPVAIALVNLDAEIIGCIRTDGATSHLLDAAITSAYSAARGHIPVPGTGLVPASNPRAGGWAPYEGVLAVAAANADLANQIVADALTDVDAFDQRHHSQFTSQ